MDELNGTSVIVVDSTEDLYSEQYESKGGPLQGKYYKQTYRKAWENLPDFKGWLQGVEGEPTRAFCSYCSVTLFAHRLSLLKHTCTLKHQKATQKRWLFDSVKSNGTISDEEPITSQGNSSEVTVSVLQDGTDQENQVKLAVEGDIMEDSQMASTSSLKTMDCVYLVPVENMDLNLERNGPVSVGLQEEVKIISLDCNSLVPADIQGVVDTTAHSTSAQPTQMQAMAHIPVFPLSTHVLDTTKGQAVGGLQVSLYRLIDGRWTLVNEGMTSQDGRCNQLIQKSDFVAGRYKLHFDTDRYFELQRKETLYPFVEIAFDVHAPEEHYHIPLLLSAFGYTTYRGS